MTCITHTGGRRLLPTRSIVCEMEGRTGCWTCTVSPIQHSLKFLATSMCILPSKLVRKVVVRISFIFILFLLECAVVCFVEIFYSFGSETQWRIVTTLGGTLSAGVANEAYTHTCVSMAICVGGDKRIKKNQTDSTKTSLNNTPWNRPNSTDPSSVNFGSFLIHFLFFSASWPRYNYCNWTISY
jgi:hypothetical protein